MHIVVLLEHLMSLHFLYTPMYSVVRLPVENSHWVVTSFKVMKYYLSQQKQTNIV